MQKGNIAMTHLSNGTVATDIDAHDDNAALSAQPVSPSATGLRKVT